MGSIGRRSVLALAGATTVGLGSGFTNAPPSATATPNVTATPTVPTGLPTATTLPTAEHITGLDNSFISYGIKAGTFRRNDFTIAFWICTSETLRYYDLIGNRTTGDHGNFVSIRMSGSHESTPPGRITAEVDEDPNGTNYIAVETTVSGLNDGAWHHVCVARKATTLSVHVDGSPAGSGTGSGIANLNNGNDLRAGRSLVGLSDRFAPDAMFDDVRILSGVYATRISSGNVVTFTPLS